MNFVNTVYYPAMIEVNRVIVEEIKAKKKAEESNEKSEIELMIYNRNRLFSVPAMESICDAPAPEKTKMEKPVYTLTGCML